MSAWTKFCDALDAHRRELAKIQARNERMRAAAAAEIRRLLAERGRA